MSNIKSKRIKRMDIGGSPNPNINDKTKYSSLERARMRIAQKEGRQYTPVPRNQFIQAQPQVQVQQQRQQQQQSISDELLHVMGRVGTAVYDTYPIFGAKEDPDYINYIKEQNRLKTQSTPKYALGGMDPLKPRTNGLFDSTSRFGNIPTDRVVMPDAPASIAVDNSSGIKAANTTQDIMAGLEGLEGIKNKVANTISTGVDIANNVLGGIQSARLKREEQQRISDSLQQRPFSNIQTTNNIPVYTKYGGMPKVEGGDSNPNVEAEDGEILQHDSGAIFESEGDRHEQGGEKYSGIERVLEDTSTKRNDGMSGLLKVNKHDASKLIGKEVNRDLSHAMLFKKMTEEMSKKQTKYLTAFKNVNKEKNPDNYTKASALINSKFAQKIPTSQEVFDTVYEHQEAIKTAAGLNEENQMEKAQYGKGPKPKPKPKKPSDTNGILLNEVTVRGKRQNQLMQDENEAAAEADAFWRSEHKDKPKIEFSLDALARADMLPLNLKTVGRDNGVVPLTISQDKVKSKFNMPLGWNDLLTGVAGLTQAMNRDPELYNPIYLNKIKFNLQDPRQALNNNQGEYNAVKANIANNSVGSAKEAQLFANKLKADADVVAQNQNVNTQILNQEEQYNTGVKDKQSLADAQSRQSYYDNVQKGRANQDEAKLKAIESITDSVSKNKAFNKNGNMIMKLAPYFDQEAEYNGRKYQFSDNTTGEKDAPAGMVKYKVTKKDGKTEEVFLSDAEYRLKLRDKTNYRSLQRMYNK